MAWQITLRGTGSRKPVEKKRLTAAVITVAVFLFYYTHYTLRGGPSDLGSDCGLFSIVFTSSPGNQSWNRGAALSFILHIILYVVVFLLLILIAVHSLLMLPLLQLLLIGTMALLYCASYYDLRGGHSGYSNRCGMFYVIAGHAFSNSSWGHGAALSFILHIILYVVVFLSLVMNVEYFMLLQTVVLLL